MSDDLFPEPPDEDEIDARLAAQKERLAQARRKYENQGGKDKLDPQMARGMGVGLSAAYAIIGLPLVGAGVGWLIDRAAGTGVFVLVGVVGGLIGGMFHAIQLSNRA